ncbi:hypothetical protein AB0J55_00910 [Amycolatopsis sp. NPDC049688]|uniref:hypothetical protein n=1 Tax=Amycolatopsis sp. NPDC049688 TaxID=3154733 RepID=UPI0034354688
MRVKPPGAVKGRLRSRDHVNLIVADKQEYLQYLDLEAVAAGASTWDRAGTGTADGEPDVVLAAG